MSIYQNNINTIIATLYQNGLRNVVICPGSRNAPLIMAFVRFKKIICTSVPDERSAGFIALGMAKQLQTPVAIICTSGSAVLNLYPAIAEAFYMQVPLLVLTADRPSDMLDRWDGQTIHQFEVFKPHILGSFETPENIEVDCSVEMIEIINAFYKKSNNLMKGPVHLNVPLKEPLYAAALENFIYPEINLEEDKFPVKEDWDMVLSEEQFIINYPKILILHGTDAPENLDECIKLIGENKYALVLSDVISNKHHIANIRNWEGVFLNTDAEQQHELVPDLLITTGKMVLNKSIKTLFRKHRPTMHWHVSESGYCADTFFTEPKIINLSPSAFFEEFSKFLPQSPSSYYLDCEKLAEAQVSLSEQTIKKEFNVFYALKTILTYLPENIVLHLANSMSVRYVAYLNEYLKDTWVVYSNRGVSGIDGCTSTAIGAAMVDKRQHVLITGDIAFFYDINALWQQLLPANFKIVLLNDFGGGIFKNIDGPKQLPELNPYLETPHQMSAIKMAEHFKLNYFKALDYNELLIGFPQWLASDKAAILEVQTDSIINSYIFNNYKKQTI